MPVMETKNSYSEPQRLHHRNLRSTRHMQKRLQQRGIGEEHICLAMDYGEAFFRQGLIFYVVGEKLLLMLPDHRLREKIKNLVVVVSPETNDVLTCYRSKKGMRHVRKKQKRLFT